MKKFSLVLLAIAMVLAPSSTAKADTVYTTSSSFATVTAGYSMTSVTFPSPDNAQGYTSDPSYYDVDGLTITSAGDIHTNDAAYYAAHGGSTSPTNYVVVFGNTIDIATIAFPASTAFSIYLGGGSDAAGETGAITLSDGFVYDFTAPAYVSSGSSLDFFGFTSSTPITSATVTFNGPDDASTEYGSIGNISYGATPEPSSLFLLGTGLLGLAFVAFRKAKSSGLVSHS
jgi:hypothetical protein